MADAFGFDGIGGGEAVGEAGTHHSGKCGDEKAFLQIEFLDRGALLLFGHFALFHRAGGAGEDDAEHADADADEDGDAGARAEDFAGRIGRERLAASSVPNAAV